MQCHKEILQNVWRASKQKLAYYKVKGSLECSHTSVSSTDVKVRTTLYSNKQYHMKPLLNSFHLYGHTLRFNPQTEKLEPPGTA